MPYRASWKAVLEYRMYRKEYKGDGAERHVHTYSSEIDRFDIQLVGPPRALAQ